jgi:predicted metalloprotease
MESIMRLERSRASTNIEDRRGWRQGRRGFFGGGIGLLLLALVGWLFGINPLTILGIGSQITGQSAPTAQPGPPPGTDGRPDPRAQQKDFIAKILGETEDTWSAIFQQAGKRYPPPTLVLFENQVESACGKAPSAVGPFYCPADQKVYIDLSFYDDLRTKFRAPGEFAQAYVIAHEVGHHVQNVLGIAAKVDAMRQRLPEREANALSVRMELQADCFAGVWAHLANKRRNILEQGDVESGLNAAAQIGDDRMMRRSQGYVVPDAFTHGSGEQRVRWFRRGLETGDINVCDTFTAKQL